ncbi:efflux RND transporter periplasmic adaptor subunit [Melioribacteraceae bacterium 4301-Me]|uniref:efflux RND transporter periplasmic adaptor subunit n=1 Tax=Pyranulibacter aquaticus TaxID=3163344 RepID=UPI0035985D67
MANGKKKNKKKLFIFGGLGLLLLIVILLVAFGGNKETIIQVQTELAAKRTITQVVSATGKINPVFQVTISAEATGEIVELPVEEGDNVRKGQLLLRIKPDIYIAQKNKAEATLAQARATLHSRQAALDQVEADYKRIQGLYGKGLASDADLEMAKSNYLQRLGDLNAQKSFVQNAEAALKEAIENLNKTTIYSPINGTISKRNVELGQRVLGSGYSPGTELLTVADLTNMEATVDVDENDVVLVSVGDTAKINIDAFGDKVFKGVVTQIGNSAKTTGLGTQDEVVNFEVKIKLLNLDPAIRPGMSCDAEIQTETKQNVVSVPIQSVTARTVMPQMTTADKSDDSGGLTTTTETKNGKNNKPKEVVFIVKNGQAKMVEVKTGISDDTYIEIVSGLQGGEEVIVGPYRAVSKELEDGSKISVLSKKKMLEKQNS